MITTPYSFVATAHALLWNGIKPVFVDISPDTFNLDPAKIEAAITPQTTAILPVHCYGTPCDVEMIEKIADRHHLRVIYDAAHAFAVKNGQDNILKHGDLSVLSFHATKIFNTFEGGAIISPNAKTKDYIDQLKNFGYVDEVTVVAPGINGKMSEVNAAFGILQLSNMDQVLRRRKEIGAYYLSELKPIKGIHCLLENQATTNYSYFPVLVEPEYPISRDALYQKLKNRHIFARRYFFPLISDFPMYRALPTAVKENLPIATQAAQQVICLPIYPSLQLDDVCRVIEIIRESA